MSEQSHTLGQSSYRRILAATSVLGGAAAVNMLISIARAKVVAVMLGPAGMGLMGLYMQVTGVITSFGSAALTVSGLREVSESLGSGDEGKARSTILTFRRVVVWLGLIGMSALMIGAPWVSDWIFQDQEHSWAIVILAVSIPAALGSTYAAVLIQAAGRLGQIAQLNILSAVVSALPAIGCIVVWGVNGIVPALLASTLIQCLFALWMTYQTELPWPNKDTRGSIKIARKLLALGSFMAAMGVMASLAGLLLRVILVRFNGEVAAGVYQSASGLSLLYSNYILGAMGTDYLPRLSRVTHDDAVTNQMVNEQTAIALLLGLPGVIGTIAFAPAVIPLFYSGEFGEAVPLLQLLSISVFGRLVSWPMSFAVIARNEIGLSLGAELVFHAVSLALVWWLLPTIGVQSTGVAMIVGFVVYSLLLHISCRRVTGLRWSREVWGVMLIGTLAMGLSLSIEWGLQMTQRWLAHGLLILIVGLICLRRIGSASALSSGAVVNKVRKLLRRGSTEKNLE